MDKEMKVQVMSPELLPKIRIEFHPRALSKYTYIRGDETGEVLEGVLSCDLHMEGHKVMQARLTRVDRRDAWRERKYVEDYVVVGISVTEN